MGIEIGSIKECVKACGNKCAEFELSDRKWKQYGDSAVAEYICLECQEKETQTAE